VAAQSVAVIGGGVAGMSAALDLSRHNLDVHLIEKDFWLGGRAIEYNCKAAGQCQQCGACLAEKKLREVNEAKNIQVHLASEIAEIRRNSGYQLLLHQAPLFTAGREQKALQSVYRSGDPQGVVLRGPSKNNLPLFVLDPDKAELARGNSDYAVLQQSLDLDRAGQQIEIQAQAVVLATGFQPFTPQQIGTYHYAVLDNVVSALDMERIRKAKGSYIRPGDGRRPQRVSFIQCVGSRSEALGHPWCSRVCCPYALRMARAIRAEHPDTEITFFYMDLQNPGRDSEQFLSSCRSDFRFIRMMPVDILPGQDGSVAVNYMPPGEQRIESEAFDLVILSVGLEPGGDNSRLSRLLGIPLDRHGFLQAGARGYQASAGNEGCFLAGTSTGPMDIQASIEQAGLAVKELLTYLGQQEKKHYGYDRRSILHAGSGYWRELDRHLHSR